MKYITTLLTICALTFLPAPVEGTAFFFIIVGLSAIVSGLSNILFTERRDERDCDAAFDELQVVNSDKCSCNGNGRFGMFIACSSSDENICLSPSDTKFCSTTIDYSASTVNRRLLGFFSSPAVQAETVVIAIDAGGFRNQFSIIFSVDGGSSEYSECSIYSTSNFMVSLSSPALCSCEICDSGIDFKYDCSNINATLAFSNVTNTTELVPGPKVESCIPVADIIPDF